MIAISQPFTSSSSPDVQAERRQALRALLRRPVLTASGTTAGDYLFVRRHFAWLKQWLARFPAWDLYIDKDVVRLRKTPSDYVDDTRSAVDATSGTPFSRRRYALLCLAMAALEKSQRQTTLGNIADAIMEFIAADPALQASDLRFDISNHDQRRDLVHAIRLLLDWGLLRRIHGDERQFLDQTGSSDVLYQIHRSALAVMLNSSRSPSAFAAAMDTTPKIESGHPSWIEQHAAALLDDSMATSSVAEDARGRQIRSRLVRALLDDPIVYFTDMTPEEHVWFQRQRHYLLRQLHEATGLIPEVRLEGIALVDDVGDVTDLRMPEDGTDGQIGLLLAPWIANHARNKPGSALPIAAVEQKVAELIRTHGSKWRKSVREPGAEIRVAEDALFRFRALRLVQITTDGVIPLAAIGRYAAALSSNGPQNQE